MNASCGNVAWWIGRKSLLQEPGVVELLMNGRSPGQNLSMLTNVDRGRYYPRLAEVQNQSAALLKSKLSDDLQLISASVWRPHHPGIFKMIRTDGQ